MNQLVYFEGEKGQVASYDLAAHLRDLNICDAGVGSGGSATLSNFRRVGVVTYKGQQIEIRPKVEIAQLLSLVDPELRSFIFLNADANLDSSGNWTETLALFFEMQLRRALSRGPMHGYVTKTEWSNTIRGRLSLASVASGSRPGSPDLLITHDDYTTDIPENQLLLAAIEVLVSNPSLSERRRVALSSHLFHFEGVHLRNAQIHEREWVSNPLFAHYEPAMKTASLILRGQSFEGRGGENAGFSFLLSTAQLFEYFLENQMRRMSIRDGFQFFAQSGGDYLDSDNLIKLKPDYVLRHKGERISIADAKYKVVESRQLVPNSDLNQMITYCTRFGLREGHLIYASSPTFHLDVRGTNCRIWIHELDLSRPRLELESQIEAIWQAMKVTAL